jgi:hypothetical protein
MIKVHKISELMHSGPDHRLPCPEALPHRGKEGTLSPDIGMTMHAGFSGWKPGKSAHFHRGVTIAAVNTQAANMMLVTELYGLLACYTLLSGVAGPVQRSNKPQHSPEDKHRSQNADPRDGVGAWIKDLCHVGWLTHRPECCREPQRNCALPQTALGRRRAAALCAVIPSYKVASQAYAG